ncbi:hypothetical protein ES708_10360 [subsurface metagenome]
MGERIVYSDGSLEAVASSFESALYVVCADHHENGGYEGFGRGQRAVDDNRHGALLLVGEIASFEGQIPFDQITTQKENY